MNEFVGFAGAPAPIWNSLILIGLTLRTFSVAVSDRFAPDELVHRALATRSPFHGSGPDVIVKIALMVVPGATGSAIVCDGFDVPRTIDVHRAGTAMLNSTPVTAAPVVFVNVNAVSCDEPGENVCKPGGVAVVVAGLPAVASAE